MEAAARFERAGSDVRRRMLRSLEPQDVAGLARELRHRYLGLASQSPVEAREVAEALTDLARLSRNAEAGALAAWTRGLVAFQLDGNMATAEALLLEAASAFEAIGQPLRAAATQVAMVGVLAVLGRYDEAAERGARARDVFEATGDHAAAGRVEHNLGNLAFRRERFAEAEALYRAAHGRFMAVGDRHQLALVSTSLANALKWQHDFRGAQAAYEEALELAEAGGYAVIAAEVEHNLGYLDLLRGRYGTALRTLGQARQRLEQLGMATQSAEAAKDQASAYLELNMAAEAVEICERLAPQFEALGMRAELAAVTATLGMGMLILGDAPRAAPVLDRAAELYAAEGNAAGEAATTLARARLARDGGELTTALALATWAETRFAESGSAGRELEARWLRADLERELGRLKTARKLLTSTLAEALRRTAPGVVSRCWTSLGLVAQAARQPAKAERAFQEAARQIEEMRAPLPAEEFRAAFLADKLTPYRELVRLCLDDPGGSRAEEALVYAERARARTLLERAPARFAAAGPELAAVATRVEELREELNWFYSGLERPPDPGTAGRSADVDTLDALAREREREIRALTLKAAELGSGAHGDAVEFDVDLMRAALGQHTALIEYVDMGDELAALVLTGDGLFVRRDLPSLVTLGARLRQFRFQVDSVRHAPGRVRKHEEQLTARALRHLAALYDGLLRPLAGVIGDRRLAVVPTGPLHHVPFAALFDGEQTVGERREVSTSPSAAILQRTLARPVESPGRVLAMGFANERIPLVEDEVRAIGRIFEGARILTAEAATVEGLREGALASDVIHLACHARFRPENPLFSGLQLADGWFTARDAAELTLSCQLVCLSACETGVNNVAAGDEILGLARGFLAAGAPSLLATLWTVDDQATASFMGSFYHRYSCGAGIAESLRAAQLELRAALPHPYFWAPFVLLGRW